jgi:hypothetical protein
MGFAFNPFTGNFDLKGSGGGASYIDGEVNVYADLPLDGTAALNSAWLVRTASGVWPVTRKQAGIYIRTATGGSNRDDDYTYAGTMPDVFSDSQFLLYNNSDSSRNLAFDLSGITTGTTRTLTVPNASGRIQIEGQPIGNTTPAAGTFTTLTANNGTLTASAPVLDLAQTWNNAAVTFTGLLANFTNTASATASRLIDLQVGGTTQFNVTRTGIVRASRYDFPDSDRGISNSGTTYIDFSSGLFRFFTGGGATGSVWLGQNIASPTLEIGGGSAISPVNTQFAVALTRDANDALAQRRGTNAQTFRLYNTFTSATNFERLNLRWASNELIIDAEAGSAGGTLRGIKLGSASTSLLGFFGATPVVRQAAVADATDAASTQARLNDLLARLRTLGLIAT